MDLQDYFWIWEYWILCVLVMHSFPDTHIHAKKKKKKGGEWGRRIRLRNNTGNISTKLKLHFKVLPLLGYAVMIIAEV